MEHGDAGEEGGKRKRGEDEMAALEAEVTGTRLPGFVSGGTVQPDQRTQEGTPADAPAAPGECFPLYMQFLRLHCQISAAFGMSARVMLPVLLSVKFTVCLRAIWHSFGEVLNLQVMFKRGVTMLCGQAGMPRLRKFLKRDRPCTLGGSVSARPSLLMHAWG